MLLGIHRSKLYRKLEHHAGRPHYFDIKGKEYHVVDWSPKLINLKLLKNTEKVVLENSGARLIDLGDEVFCLEFNSPNNAIGADILSMITSSIEYVSNKGTGLVIGNQGKNFCVGANLMAIFMEAQDKEWDEIDLVVRMFQKAMLTIKYCPKPVVAAPFNMALGGGCESGYA